MKKFFGKVKAWFVAHKPTKRRLIQLYAALLTNANLKGFFTGKIYTGDTKKMCVPGLNCYSCPGAVGACPLGALQDSLAQSGKSAPAYILGILLMFGLLLGRLICGFLCPFGLIQELLYKIRTPKLRKNRFTRVLSYFKYVLLVIVIAVPLIYAGIPSFCKYVCPAGTLEGAVSLLANIQNSDFYGMLGYLFTWKFCLAVVIVVASVFIYRFFCRFICPLGAIYSLFNKISLLGVKLDKDKCIDCGLCVQGCKMDVKHVGDHECIQCGECISVCPVQAITWKGSQIFLKNTTPIDQPVVESGEKIALLELAKSNASVAVASADPEEVSGNVTESAQNANIEAESEFTATDGQEAAVGVEAQEEAVKPATEGAKKGGRLQAVKAAFKRPRFVVEFVAWVVAIAVLISALICYNLPERKSAAMLDLTVTTYKSAASEGEKDYSTVSDDNRRVKVLYFWRTDLEESVAAMEELNELATLYKQLDFADVVAIHSIYKDDRDVQAFIDEHGWNEYNVIFAQDDRETNAYGLVGGDISVPKPITAIISADGGVTLQKDRVLSMDEVINGVTTAMSAKVFKEGDTCPLFVLDRYNAEEGAKVSLLESRGKVTVLNYWYTDCDPCKAELPEFEKVYEDYDGAIDMFVIHSYSAVPSTGVQYFLDTAKDKNCRAWNSYKLTFAQDTQELNTYAMLGGKYAYPMTVIVNAEGKITFVNQGPCSEEVLKQEVEKALG